MNASYYESEGMNNIMLHVPPLLRKEFRAQAKREGIPMRALYSNVLNDFVLKVESALKQKKLDSIVFHATYKHAEAVKLQMWVDSALSDAITRLCDKAAVSRRAFCYTALLTHFNSALKGD